MVKIFLAAFFCLSSGINAQAPPFHWPDRPGALDEYDSLQRLPTKEAGVNRFIMGDVHGYVRVYEGSEKTYQEVWISDYLEGEISGIAIADVNGDEKDEIVVFTERGRFHYFDLNDYGTIWSNPPDEYQSLTAMAIHNIDDDPQPELILCADRRLVIYDGRDQFEQWRSDQTELTTSDILVADVDGDDREEIILNDGYIFDANFFDLEWQAPEPFGDRIGLLDVDGDQIPELIGEFRGRFLRTYDLDLRREKAIGQ